MATKGPDKPYPTQAHLKKLRARNSYKLRKYVEGQAKTAGRSLSRGVVAAAAATTVDSSDEEELGVEGEANLFAPSSEVGESTNKLTLMMSTDKKETNMLGSGQDPNQQIGFLPEIMSMSQIGNTMLDRVNIFSKSSESYLPDWLADKTNPAKCLKQMGFRPKMPIACINSMGGCQLEVLESTLRPKWVGGKVVLDLPMVTEGFLTNQFSMYTGSAWKSKMKDILDQTEDNVLTQDELRGFIEAHDSLKKDADVQSCLKQIESSGATDDAMLSLLEPVKGQLIQAATEEQFDQGGISEYTVYAQAVYAQHMEMVDGWKDPSGIKVRPVEEPNSLDTIMAMSDLPIIKDVSALMGPILAPLVEFGYEPGKNIRAFPYDWRAALSKLEARDKYFSRMVDGIESMVKSNGQKCVVMSHSMGGRIALYFFHWMTDSSFGKSKGGKQWLDEYIHSFVPIASPNLGAASGSIQHIFPGTVMGLCPAVLNAADGLAMIRSMASICSLWGSGKNLMYTAGSHYFFTRKQGAFHIELLSATYDESVTGDTYVKLEVAGKSVVLKSSTKKGPTPTFGNIFQFSWEDGPDDAENRTLHIKFLQKRGLTGLRDHVFAETHLAFSNTPEGGVTAISVGALDDSVKLYSAPGSWSLLDGVAVGDSVKLKMRVKWIPSNAPVPKFYEMSASYSFATHSSWCTGLGGSGDEGTSEEKQQLLKEAGITEWVPSGKHEYDARSFGDMLALEELPALHAQLTDLCAKDLIFRKTADGLAPALKLVLPIYGCEVDTDIGLVMTRKDAVWEAGQRLNYFEEDHEAEMHTPGYKIVKGTVREVPGECPQASDTEGKKFGELFRSGDGTVPYWSNRSPEKWANDGCQVNIIEVKGAGHRTINEQAAAHFSVIMHVADEPDVTLRIEELLITDPFDKVAAKKNPYDKKKMSPTQVGTFLGQTSSADALKVYVRVDFGGQKVETAAVLMDQCTGSVPAEQLFGSTREFVFDPTYQVEATVKVKTWKGMWAGAGSKLAGTKSVKINFYEMITASTTKGLIELKFAEGVTVKLSVVGFEAGEKPGCCHLGNKCGCF